MQKENRSQQRYGRGELTISIARRGLRGVLSRNPTTHCTNFNQEGLQFTSNKTFEDGDVVVVDLILQENAIHELYATVCYCRKEEDHFVCGLSFDFTSKRMQEEEVKHTLMKIENSLRLLEKYPEIMQQV